MIQVDVQAESDDGHLSRAERAQWPGEDIATYAPHGGVDWWIRCCRVVVRVARNDVGDDDTGQRVGMWVCDQNRVGEVTPLPDRAHRGAFG